MKKLKLILKFNPYHDSEGLFSTKGSPHLKIVHNTRFSSLKEYAFQKRFDLGYFKHRVPREINSSHEAEIDPIWKGSETKLSNALSPDEKKALKGYTGSSDYSKINKALVSGHTSDASIHKKAKDLYSAVMKSSLPEDVMLHRGMMARGLFTEKEGAIGKVYTDKVFKSTSLSQDTAVGFALARKDAVMVRIKSKKGQIGAYLDGELSTNPHEGEVVLPPKATMLVTGHSLMEVVHNGKKTTIDVYDAEYI
jgi:hypothetical protein